MRTRRICLLSLAALTSAASAQNQRDDDAAFDAAARAALSRAEIRKILTEIRVIQGLPGGVGGGARAIEGDVAIIATIQRTLDQSGLATRIVNGTLEVSLPGDVLFDFDKAALRPNAIPTLEKVKQAASRSGDRPVRIEGHTDAIGMPARNQPLSEARAGAVANWLAAAGIARARITSAGFGATRPVAPNRTPAGADDPAAGSATAV